MPVPGSLGIAIDGSVSRRISMAFGAGASFRAFHPLAEGAPLAGKRRLPIRPGFPHGRRCHPRRRWGYGVWTRALGAGSTAGVCPFAERARSPMGFPAPERPTCARPCGPCTPTTPPAISSAGKTTEVGLLSRCGSPGTRNPTAPSTSRRPAAGPVPAWVHGLGFAGTGFTGCFRRAAGRAARRDGSYSIPFLRRNPKTKAATSAVFSSAAKWPASKRWSSAPGMSLR